MDIDAAHWALFYLTLPWPQDYRNSVPESYGSDYDSRPALQTNSDAVALAGSFLEKWCGEMNRRQMAEDIWTIINWERERCAKIADSFSGATVPYAGPTATFIAAKIRAGI